jgi:4-carboxymuconolactone decarboxylase
LVARLDPIPLEDLTPEQKAIHAKLASTRKQVTGPFAIWLRTPNVAYAADEFMNSLRRDGKLDKRLYELIVMIVTRHWSARYAWAQHEPLAVAAGLSPDVIAAIREIRTPAFSKPDEQLLYDMATELLDTMELSAATYDRMLKQFGVERTIEAISVTGFYGMVSTVLKGFDVPTLSGQRPF